ncbi:Endogenous alpha-amylase/subtilisin inhibitor [Bienertia sinuspersici]
MDADGEPMLNGGTYYILPQNGSGLTFVPPNTTSPCSLYITQESDPTSDGLPIKISSPINSKYLPFGSTIFTFPSDMITTPCIQQLEWRPTHDDATGLFYVVAGTTTQEAAPSAFNIIVPFNYGQPGSYQLNYCNDLACGALGIFQENRLLGITNDTRFTVRFKKAFFGTSGANSVV